MTKEWIAGRNPVFETLTARRRHFFELRIAKGVELKGRLSDIATAAHKMKLPFLQVSRQQLDQLAENHQGIALQVSPYPYVDIHTILKQSTTLDEPGFYLILDSLQDPQNLGTLLRTAEVVGVHGVFIPSHRAAGVTPAVVHSSSGACEHLRIATGNLAQIIEVLKQSNIWVMGLEGSKSAESIGHVDLSGPLALVVGSEGSGLRELVRNSCDLLISLPMRGRVESLNASVAGSIALFQAFLARSKTQPGK